MKLHFITLGTFILFLSCISTLYAQPSWFEEGTTYTYFYQSVVDGSLHQGTLTVNDTEFAGRECSKLSNFDDFSEGCAPFELPYYFYESNDSVFYASEVDSTFRLAYDIGAEVGDSWVYVVPNSLVSENDTFFVEVIDTQTLQIGGNEVRELVVSVENPPDPIAYISPTTFSIYEFMGSERGTVSNFGLIGICDNFSLPQLQCFSSPSFEYINPEFGSCIVSAENIGKGAAELKVFPNPTDGNLSITGNYTKANIQIFNTKGAKVFEKSFQSESINLDLHFLPSGIYFLNMRNIEGLNQCTKFVRK